MKVQVQVTVGDDWEMVEVEVATDNKREAMLLALHTADQPLADKLGITIEQRLALMKKEANKVLRKLFGDDTRRRP